MSSEKLIYLDYNATTPIDREVADEMKPFLYDHFGNPSSIHEFGVVSKQAVTKARKRVADLLNCSPDEIIFTSGGTESNNFAIKGIALENRRKGNHIITSCIEHPAIIEVCKFLAEDGFEITYLPVDKFGMINPVDVMRSIRNETVLISIMHANNEVGTIQPIHEIGLIAKQNNIIFHTDAAQSLGKINVDVQQLGIDLLSIAGHKIYAPKGVGALYIKRGTNIQKLIHGANHEMNFRAGTENVMEIAGLGKACEIAARDLDKNHKHCLKMRDMLHHGLVSRFQEIKLNGHSTIRLPNTLSLGFYEKKADKFLTEMNNVAASAGAACHTESNEISYVLKAMGIPEKYAAGTIRFSTGKYTCEADILQAIDLITNVLEK